MSKAIPQKPDDKKSKALVEKQKIAKELNEAFGSSAGRRALRLIMEMCGYQKFDVVIDPTTGEINQLSSFYNQARRSVYLNIRSYLRRDILAAVENQGLSSDDAESLF